MSNKNKAYTNILQRKHIFKVTLSLIKKQEKMKREPGEKRQYYANLWKDV